MSLQDNLSGTEMPPPWKWPFPWEMKRHIAQVVADRKKPKKTGDDDPDPDDDDPDLDLIDRILTL